MSLQNVSLFIGKSSTVQKYVTFLFSDRPYPYTYAMQKHLFSSGWWFQPTPLKHLSSSVGIIMIIIPTWMESHNPFHGSSHHSPVIGSVCHIPTKDPFQVTVTTGDPPWLKRNPHEKSHEITVNPMSSHDIPHKIPIKPQLFILKPPFFIVKPQFFLDNPSFSIVKPQFFLDNPHCSR